MNWAQVCVRGLPLLLRMMPKEEVEEEEAGRIEEERKGEVGGKRERVGRDQEGAEEEANSSQYICTLDFFESTLACVK